MSKSQPWDTAVEARKFADRLAKKGPPRSMWGRAAKTIIAWLDRYAEIATELRERDRTIARLEESSNEASEKLLCAMELVGRNLSSCVQGASTAYKLESSVQRVITAYEWQKTETIEKATRIKALENRVLNLEIALREMARLAGGKDGAREHHDS